jgi:hypothetical protein
MYELRRQGILVKFMRVIIYIRGRPLWSRGNGSTLEGFTERAPIRREQRNIMYKNQNLTVRNMFQGHQLQGSMKHLSLTAIYRPKCL